MKTIIALGVVLTFAGAVDGLASEASMKACARDATTTVGRSDCYLKELHAYERQLGHDGTTNAWKISRDKRCDALDDGSMGQSAIFTVLQCKIDATKEKVETR